MEVELRKARIKCDDASIVAQLQSAATTHGLTAKDMVTRLNAHIMNTQGAGANQTATAGLVTSFLSALQRECNKENQARGAATPGMKWNSNRDFTGFTDRIKGEQQGPPATPLTGRIAAGGAGLTPSAAANKPSPTTPQSAPTTAFKIRTNRGQVLSTLNSGVPRATTAEARFLHAEPLGVQLPARHLYLMERLEDKVAAVNNRIKAWRKWLTSVLAAAQRAEDKAAEDSATAQGLEVAPVGVPVQEESYFVGRVVCEVEGGVLNDTAVVLEGDSFISEGARVHLDLSHLSSYRLFPGQIIAVKGVNPSGSRILAKHIWTHIPPHSSHKAGQTAAADTTATDAMDVDDMGVGGSDVCSSGLSVVVAAGPFCLADDLAYDPLHELLQDLKSSPPNMLVLMGPFVDVEQPLIAGGMINVTFQQLFQTQVLERVHAWQAALSTPCQVVLMPAVRDAFHHPTFPQPAFDLPPEQQLVSLQNPCSFSTDGLVMCGVTTDVLRHLSSVELAKTEPGVTADRLGALASHVLGQRRFYPLYPAPLGTCLDLTADPALMLQQLPHMLLLPSDLAPFAKLVAAAAATATGGGYAVPNSPAADGAPQVVVVNPGRLAKGGSGGTYAHVTIAAGSGSIVARCRVDIVRV